VVNDRQPVPWRDYISPNAVCAVSYCSWGASTTCGYADRGVGWIDDLAARGTVRRASHLGSTNVEHACLSAYALCFCLGRLRYEIGYRAQQRGSGFGVRLRRQQHKARCAFRFQPADGPGGPGMPEGAHRAGPASCPQPPAEAVGLLEAGCLIGDHLASSRGPQNAAVRPLEIPE